MAGPRTLFHRVVLKLSGEALMGDEPYGIDPDRIAGVARQVHESVERGVEVAIVVARGTSSAACGARPWGWTGRRRTTWG